MSIGSAVMRGRMSDLEFECCALCGQSSKLQSSHIIPSFVFQWLRESSGTGYMRSGITPNMRVQDGWKPRMLCVACEQRIGTWEKAFAEQCFAPLLSGKTSRIKYRPWMLKFAASVSWRVLRVFGATDGLAGFPTELVAASKVALDEWAAFLLDERPHPGRHEQHMLLMDAIESNTIVGMPANINRYLLRVIEMDIVRSDTSALVYAKMGKFLLFAFIHIPNSRDWKGTKLHANEGTFGAANIQIPEDIWAYVMERAKRAAARYSDISERQRAKIEDAYWQDLDRAANSEGFRAMDHDVLLFGQDAFEVTRRKEK